MSEKKTVLAVETSTKKGSISLLSKDKVIDTYQLADNEPVSEFLLTKIKELLRQNNLTLSDIGLVAVCLGPGSLTGLRVGIAIGQGLANSLEIPCVGVSIFEALIAENNESDFYLISAGFKKFYWQIKQQTEFSEIKTGTIQDISNDLEQYKITQISITKDASDNVNKLEFDDSNQTKIIDNLVELIGKTAVTKEKNKNINSLTPIYIGETGFKKIVI